MRRMVQLMWPRLGCDFLVCSTYKFFGPHMGVLYGEDEFLERFRPYKLRANSDAIPSCWEWGTINLECIAGITACVEYLEESGRHGPPGFHSPRSITKCISFDTAT